MIPRALWESARDLQTFLDSCGYQFCFIGGIAYQRWGEPRVTQDLDATVIAPFGEETPVVQMILKRYQSRIPDALEFALKARVLLLQDIAGHGIDLSLGGLPYEQRVVDRATLWGTPASGRIRTCSAEDVVVLKAFASRSQDWIDVEKVIIRQGDQLNRDLICDELQPLVDLKEEPEIMDQLNQLLSAGG